MTNGAGVLGRFPVERELGRGGMGVVYLARDPKLDRSVAIKVLPEAFERDPERLARFEREAKILASLNHPNIAAIYGIEEVEGRRLLILEYVPGDTLAARTARGALPLDEVLEICRQIAAAVEVAHDNGVIHRDLKPGNVKITPDGQVKVLDFGLAKGGASAGSGSGSEPDLSQSPTLTYASTGAGVILGTAAYMSPEQARGRAVDRRTDIWSFGCVLYESLTGRQVFEGETVSDTIARILEREPDWSLLPGQTPATVRELLRRCLEKDAKKRQRDIGDARLELEGAIAARSTATRAAAAAAEARRRATVTPRLLALGALLLVVGAAAGIGLWSGFGPAKPGGGVGGPVRLSVAVPREIRAFGAQITPDGRTIVLSGQARRPDGTTDPVVRLYARPIDRYELKPIAGTENVQQGWTLSPDGKWIAFLAPISEETSQRRLFKVPLDGSLPPVALADWNDAWGNFTWLERGDLLISMDNSTRFFRLPSGGGPPGQPVKLDLGGISGGVDFRGALPGDRRVLIQVAHWSPRGWQADIWLLDPVTGKASLLLENAGDAAYSPTGHLLFARGDGLFAVAFDADRLRIRGDVAAVQSGVRAQWSWGHGRFSFATRSGTLLFPPGGRVGTRRSLMVVSGTGSASPYVEERRGFELPPALSRDGRRVAVVIANARGVYEIWCSDPDRPGLRRCAALPGADCFNAVWSPDGRRLAFSRTARDKDDGIYLVDTDEAGPAEPLVKNGSEKIFHSATSWAPDGSGLLVSKFEDGKGDILFVPVAVGSAPGEPRALRATPSSEGAARFSPDGRLVALSSDESGKFEVHVAPYRADGTLGPPILVSRGSGRLAFSPAWSGDGHRLFFVTDADQLWSASITSAPRLSASAPVQVLDFRKLRVDGGQYDVLPDGRVLVVQKGEEEDDITQFDVVLNWAGELRGRVGGSREARSGR